MPVQAEVRYLNDEWRQRDEIPRIGDRESRRANTSKHVVSISDARDRLAAGAIDLDSNGFALLNHASAVSDFRDEDAVKATYYPEIVALAKRATGAREVIVTQHVVRTEDTSDFNKAYARFLHCDYSLADPRAMAVSALEKQGLAPADYQGCDFAWYNSWQPFDNPAAKNPLCVVDAATLADDDVVDYYYTGYGNSGKSAMPMRSQSHRFYYFSDMATDELLLLKQLDTRGRRAAICPHTSFDNPDAPADAPPRRSIEVRVMAVFGPSIAQAA